MTDDTKDTREDAERLGRLRYRAWRRGFAEADLLMGGFADKHLERLTSDQLDAYERLLDVNDHDLYAWIARGEAPPAEHDTDVMAMLRNFDYLSAPRPS